MSLYAFFPKRSDCVHSTVIELDSLSNPDRACPKNKNLLLICGVCLAVVFVSRIVIRSSCFELGCTGIYHLESSNKTGGMPEITYLLASFSSQFGKAGVREAHPFCFTQEFRSEFFCPYAFFHIHDSFHL